jgi:hypothetical protein
MTMGKRRGKVLRAAGRRESGCHDAVWASGGAPKDCSGRPAWTVTCQDVSGLQNIEYTGIVRRSLSTLDAGMIRRLLVLSSTAFERSINRSREREIHITTLAHDICIYRACMCKNKNYKTLRTMASRLGDKYSDPTPQLIWTVTLTAPGRWYISAPSTLVWSPHIT